jgi:hypothetical protein
MNILGLGKGGCAIADLFSQYPEYKVFKADVGLKGKNCLSIPACKTIEEYEEKLAESFPPQDIDNTSARITFSA